MHILRRYRKDNNLTQKELAEKLGLTPSSIGHFECGRRKLKPELAAKIESVTGIPRLNILYPE